MKIIEIVLVLINYATVFNKVGSENVNVGSNLTMSTFSLTGTAGLVIADTCTWSGTSTTGVTMPLTIDASGKTITVSSTVYTSGSFTVANGTVSGGQFVMSAGTDGAVVGSGANTYVASDILTQPALLNDNVLGLALYNVASGTNNYVAVARRGCFLVQATGVVSGGQPVSFNSGGVVNLMSAANGSATIPGIGQYFPVGRALTPGDSGGYALVSLML